MYLKDPDQLQRPSLEPLSARRAPPCKSRTSPTRFLDMVGDFRVNYGEHPIKNLSLLLEHKNVLV